MNREEQIAHLQRAVTSLNARLDELTTATRVRDNQLNECTAQLTALRNQLADAERNAAARQPTEPPPPETATALPS